MFVWAPTPIESMMRFAVLRSDFVLVVSKELSKDRGSTTDLLVEFHVEDALLLGGKKPIWPGDPTVSKSLLPTQFAFVERRKAFAIRCNT